MRFISLCFLTLSQCFATALVANEFDASKAIKGLRNFEKRLDFLNVEYEVLDISGRRIQIGVALAVSGNTLNRYKYFDDDELLRVVRKDASFTLTNKNGKWIPSSLAPAQSLNEFPAIGDYLFKPIEITSLKISDLLETRKATQEEKSESPIVTLSNWSQLIDGQWKGVIRKDGNEFGYVILDPGNDWLCSEQQLDRSRWSISYASEGGDLNCRILYSFDNETKRTVELKWHSEIADRAVFYLTNYGLSESLLASPSGNSPLSYFPFLIGAIGCVLILVALTLRKRRMGWL